MWEHEQVDEWVRAQRAAGHTIGFTCGAFDLLHAGHVDYLEQARAECDALLVAVNSDASIRRYKSPLRPIVPQAQRMRVVSALKSVDAVTLLDDDRPVELIRRWKPDLYIKGGDYDAARLRSAADVEAYGGRVVRIPVRFATSTSALMERIAELQLHATVPHAGATFTGIVFLDRDGTLIRNVPFLNDPSRVELIEGVGPALRSLQDAGMRLVVVTNQQGIGLGYFSYDEFIAVNRAMLRQLATFGVRISKILFCPHSMADDCECRKPQPAMLEQVLKDDAVAREHCYFVGDSPEDKQAADAAHIRYFAMSENNTFAEAASQILEEVNRGRYAKL